MNILDLHNENVQLRAERDELQRVARELDVRLDSLKAELHTLSFDSRGVRAELEQTRAAVKDFLEGQCLIDAETGAYEFPRARVFGLRDRVFRAPKTEEGTHGG